MPLKLTNLVDRVHPRAPSFRGCTRFKCLKSKFLNVTVHPCTLFYMLDINNKYGIYIYPYIRCTRLGARVHEGENNKKTGVRTTGGNHG